MAIRSQPEFSTPYANRSNREKQNHLTCVKPNGEQFTAQLKMPNRVKIIDLFVCLVCFFTSTQQSFSYAGRVFLG